MLRSLNDYAELLIPLHKSIIESVDFRSNPDFTEVMRQPRLVVAINHSTPLSWLPAMTTLALHAIQADGGDRTPRGIMDRWFYSNPVTKLIAQYLGQSEQPLNFEQLLENFKSSRRCDVVIFPEGALTFFGSVHEVQEFRSYRFVELAIRAQAPLLLVGHKGSENWSIPLQIPPEWGAFLMPYSSFFGERLLKAQTFNLPIIPHKILSFKMNCELYWPDLKETDLSEDPEICKSQIKGEAEKVRLLMQALIQSV